MPILIPARNSQHRFACLALYRALLRSAGRIPLPPELTFNGKHPIRAALRRQFRKNRADTSPRLVYAGLSAGYKFLALFGKAKVVTSSEYESILNEVKDRVHAFNSRPPRPEPPKRPSIPLLTRLPPKTDDPNERPVYKATVRPLPKSALKGERKIPHLCATSFGVPFLRITKGKQPPKLSGKLQSFNKKIQLYAQLITRIPDVLIPDVYTEDRWERMMGKLAREESQRRKLSDLEEDLLLGDRGATYVRNLNEVRGEIISKLNKIKREHLAKAKAMVQLIREEEALAEIERREEDTRRRRREKMAT